MKKVYIILFLLLFVSFSHAQDLFDQAEIEFDIDYIDIDKVKLLGKGQVMAVWMKSGSVLTKTLSKSNSKFKEDRELYNGEDYRTHIFVDNKNPWDMNTDELITAINDILSSPDEWTNDERRSSFVEELDLMKCLMRLRGEGNKGQPFVELAINVITADIKHGASPDRLRPERGFLLDFAQGDEQLTKMANDFLKENGFADQIE